MWILRPFSIAAFAIAILFPVISSAQRGMAGGGGHGMAVGGHVMTAGGGHSAGSRSAGPARVAGGRIAARPGVAARPAMGARRVVRSNHFGTTIGRFPHDRDRFGFRHRCFGGFPCRDRFFNSGLVLPYGYYPYFDSFSDNYAQPQQPEVVGGDNESAGSMQLAMEVQRLSDEIEQLRGQDRQAAARTQPQGSLSAQSPAESTAFIFRDGHRINVQNYAVVGDTLWVLGQHTAKKVSLESLDKAATEQANAANGIELRLP